MLLEDPHGLAMAARVVQYLRKAHSGHPAVVSNGPVVNRP
jgi:hypothetical protein